MDGVEPPQPRPQPPQRPQWSGLKDSDQRKSLTAAEPAYLLAEWLNETDTGRPLPAAGGWLATHYEKMADSSSGSGLLVAAVDASGTEKWRHAAGENRVTRVVAAQSLVVLLLEGDENPWTLEALELATGKLVWMVNAKTKF